MEIVKNDIIRQEYLEKLGYSIIRFTDEEILKELTSIGVIIEQETLEQENLLGLVKRL
jgi:very-short-patch-repair endonuclease